MSGALTPITPALTLRPARKEDAAMILPFLNEQLARTPYAISLDSKALNANLLQANPPSLYPVRWHRHQSFCLWRAGALEGLIDVAVGFDSDSLTLPDYTPLGLLRFFALPSERARIDAVAAMLFTAATDFWQQHGVAQVKAFHPSTGYPEFQAGFGALPGAWHDHIRLLTTANFHFTERYYAFVRPLDQPLEEDLPTGGLSFVTRMVAVGRHYQLYHHAEWVGEAQVTELQSMMTTSSGAIHPLRIANLLKLEIHPEWRGRDIGKWLLRRLINDAALQGYHQMLAHIPHRAFIMQNLLAQHGFQEQNYRGYTLERALTS